MPSSKSKSERVLGPKDLAERGIRFSPNHLRVLWTRGDFPAPFKLSARKFGWREAVIDEWIRSKVEAA
jgi:hypothetical protein